MSDTLLTLGRARPAPRAPVLLQAGFRPFFLLAALAAAVSIIGWLAVLHGVLVLPGATVDLHVHEMVFGFTTAVIAGFLLTAVKNWTNREPAPPIALASLVALFIAGRVAVVVEATGALPGIALVEVLFLPALVIAVAIPIVKSRNKRNAGVLALVAFLALVDIGMHAAAWNAWPTLALSMRGAALLAPCVLIAVIGGRVIPLFTRNVVRDDGKDVREPNALDNVALAAAVLVMIAAVTAPFFGVARVVEPFANVAAGALLLLRMRGWATMATLRRPILWVLHVGYAALGVGFILRGVSSFVPTFVPSTAASHVLAVGAIAVMSLGMMTRVSLGHTGRRLAVPRTAVAAYAALLGATIARVAAVWWPWWLVTAGVLLALGFALFLVAYLPVLVAPRVDGKPG